MGFIPNVPEDGFSVETRRESFVIRPSEKWVRAETNGIWNDLEPERWFVVNCVDDSDSGSVEFNYKDIPALRRALDIAEKEHPELIDQDEHNHGKDSEIQHSHARGREPHGHDEHGKRYEPSRV